MNRYSSNSLEEFFSKFKDFIEPTYTPFSEIRIASKSSVSPFLKIMVASSMIFPFEFIRKSSPGAWREIPVFGPQFPVQENSEQETDDHRGAHLQPEAAEF